MNELKLQPGFIFRALLLIVAGVVVIDGIHQILYARSALGELGKWLRGHATDDSWRHMRQAYAVLRGPRDDPAYQEIFFDQKIKFQYLLTSLLPFYFAEKLGIFLGNRTLNFVSGICVVLQILAVAQVAVMAFRRRVAAGAGALVPQGPAWGVWAVAAVAALLFYPQLKAYSLGQVQAWLNAWFALACLAWMLNRPFAAGMLVALVCLFKPQFALFLPWALLRRQWHFVAGWCAVAFTGAAMSLAFFGWRDNLDYLSVLSFMSRHGEAYYPNQSVNGLLNRLLGNGDSTQWESGGFPPYHAVVHAATILTSALLVGFCLFHKFRAANFSVVDVLIAALSFTMASPIAWEHHYGGLVVAFPVLALLLLEWSQPRERRMLLALLAVSWLLCSRFWPSAQELAPTWANPLQSYLFFGFLALLWLMYRVRDFAADRLGQTPATAGRRPQWPLRRLSAARFARR
ncbi:glycosyltransferase family 87 protein [Azohydromonas aeria]|uniref:glycosyltransferase family 87 protein n=1 Tax=Azohydromonas aeria TaxID=2590212 RepID=UPI0012FB562B|nr:glycosyltransferase family 87 protein [Azohydromonas aeria]